MLVLILLLLLLAVTHDIHCRCAAAFSADNKIPPPPPISLPVWSLAASTDKLKSTAENKPSSVPTATATTSMNIVTFCTAVSVASPKLWIVSLYYDTLTKDSFLSSGRGVLQLLSPSQKHLVPILGKRSGYEPGYTKESECAKLGFDWVGCHQQDDEDADEDSNTIQLLPDCATYIHLKVQDTMPAGDHIVALCVVVQTSCWSDDDEKIVTSTVDDSTMALGPSTVLYTGQLREEGIL